MAREKGPLQRAAEAQGAKPAEDWQEISIEFYRFTEPGQTVEGILLRKDVQTIRDTEVGRYEVGLADGTRIAFLGGVQLDRLMDDVDTGDTIKLVFRGRVKTTGGTEVKDFQMFRKTKTA